MEKKWRAAVLALLLMEGGPGQALAYEYYEAGMVSRPAAPSAAAVPENRQYAEEVVRLVNVERQKAGLAPLRMAEDLMDAAVVRAGELSRKYSHTRPDGSSATDMIHGVRRKAGENIAAGYDSPEAAVDGWMHSAGHRENILDPLYTEIGVGYCHVNGDTYGSYWVQLFRG